MAKTEFDDFAESYREIHTQNVQGVSGQGSDYFSEYKIRELFSRNCLTPDATWLDLGCGDGNTCQYIKKYFPSSSYYGIDVSEESIHAARERSPEESFQCYDGEHIPFADQTFDIVYIACVLHHVIPENRSALIKECKRVLKRGGLLIIFEHNPHNPVTMNLVNNCPFDADASLLNWPVCRDLIIEGGLQIVKKRYTIFMPRKGIFEKLIGIEKYLSWFPLGGQYYVMAGRS